jgi:hypothetical protein
MIDTGYDDDPREMLKLMQRVHAEHPRTRCFNMSCSVGYEEAQETGPETVRLLTRQEAEDTLGSFWVEDTLRSFFYANGMSCRGCGENLGKGVAIYGPPAEDRDAPLSEYECYAS